MNLKHFLSAGILLSLAISASAQGVWTNRSSGTLNVLTAVAHSSTLNLFVAVGRSGTEGFTPATILTSPDGVTWTSRTSNSNNGLLGVTWTGTQFVAVGNSGAIVTSPDGITWTKQTAVNGNALEDVVWTGTQLVATGSNGAILTSPTGVTWTVRIPPVTSVQLTSLAWTGSLLVVVGSGGTIMTSPDGITWTARTSGTGNLLNGVTWSGSKLVALSNSQLDGFLPAYSITSTDGIAWTAQTTGFNGAFYGVAWIGTQFLGIGQGGTIRTSTDGVAWTNQTSGTTANLFGVTRGGSTLVAVGGLANGGSPSVTILTSEVGSTSVRRHGDGASALIPQGIRGSIQGYRADGRIPGNPVD